jgi:YesN/AraC family two-component response regulator
MAEEHPHINIGIVDDHNLFRKGLIKLINLADVDRKYAILFEAANGHEMQEKLSKKPLPDIILMDIDMPDMNGYTAVGWLRKYHPDIKVLVISIFRIPYQQ